MEENKRTIIGVWMNGLIQLKKNGFTDDEIYAVSAKTSNLLECMFRYYDYSDMNFQHLITIATGEWFAGLIALKKAGYSFDEIEDFMEDIENAYYYLESDDDYDYDDNDDMPDYFFDNDDGDDDDDDDDDKGFDPKKFFPRK